MCGRLPLVAHVCLSAHGRFLFLSFPLSLVLPTHFPQNLQVVAELEALHSTAADELSALYEARLALEAERAAQVG